MLKIYKGGSINIIMYSDRHNIFVEVKDNGIGIKEEDMPFIFESFQ
ncbi:MAG: sensor histidine kinase [Clostridiaceae bacterium]